MEKDEVKRITYKNLFSFQKCILWVKYIKYVHMLGLEFRIDYILILSTSSQTIKFFLDIATKMLKIRPPCESGGIGRRTGLRSQRGDL